jgi:putative hemolysin
MIDRLLEPDPRAVYVPVPQETAATPTPLAAEVFPHHPELIPPGIVSAGAYALRFAWSRADLLAVQALRYRIFMEELGEGEASATTAGATTTGVALDADARDPWFHHLMIIHEATGEVVGTYRLQTVVMAATRFGYYSASLFELGGVPASVLREAVEVGRACVDIRHRSGRVLRLLWQGIARYLQWNSTRYVFGCCSIAGVDPVHAASTWKALHDRHALHADIFVRPHAAARALADDGRTVSSTMSAALLPPLFDGYLSLGARVCSAPALDHAFGTTDYLVMLDVEAMDARGRRAFFG